MPELISIKLGVEGVDEINAKLGLAISRLNNPVPAHEALVSGLVENWFRRRFQSSGAKGLASQRYPKWKQYEDEPKYLARKRGLVGGGRRKKKYAPLLWRKGRATKQPNAQEALFRSFTGDHGFGQRWHVRNIKRTGFEIGSRIPYAANHQFGRGFQRWDQRRIPKRQIVVRDPKLFRALVNSYQKYVFGEFDGGIRGARRVLTKSQLRRAFRNA